MIKQHGGFLPVQDVQVLQQEFDLTENQLLQALLPVAKEAAVVPFSQFRVGAIAVGATGNLYFGANMELNSLPLILAVHAEQSAVVMAHTHGETGISKIISSEKPCGFCRQFLFELPDAGQLGVLLPDGHLTTLSRLLPDAFSAKDLGVKVDLLADKQRLLQVDAPETDELAAAALQAANHAYAPFTKAYAGVALQTEDGRIYLGSYLENAAFNPSLAPLQAAFVYVVQSGASLSDVREAVLVEVKDSAMHHAALTEMTLKTLCPQAHFRVVEAAL